MVIRNGDDGSVIFELSREEAGKVQIDHGRNELCLPCPDTFEAVYAMGAALRGELVWGSESVIEALPE